MIPWLLAYYPLRRRSSRGCSSTRINVTRAPRTLTTRKMMPKTISPRQSRELICISLWPALAIMEGMANNLAMHSTPQLTPYLFCQWLCVTVRLKKNDWERESLNQLTIGFEGSMTNEIASARQKVPSKTIFHTLVEIVRRPSTFAHQTEIWKKQRS